MSKPGLDELLIQCVLDDALLQRLRTAPDSVLDDYQLTEQTRAALVHPDRRLLPLLGTVVEGQAQRTKTPPRTAAPLAVESIAAASVALGESRIALRLVPYVYQETGLETVSAETSQTTVTYAAHLDQLTAGTELSDLPPVPQVATVGQPSPSLGLVVTVQPAIATDAAGNQQVTFSVTAQLPQDARNEPANTPVATESACSLSPWNHDVDSEAVRAAAMQVHESAPEGRYQRLLDLIKAMVATEPDTETDR